MTHTEDSSFLLIYYKVFLFKIKSLEKTLARSFIMFADFNSNKNNDDFLDEFRQKLNNEPDESFEERKNEISRSKNVFVGTVSGIAMAAVVGWLVLSPRYTSENNTELPVVRRPQTAIKVQPAEPGGMEIQNQDKSVYDIIEKKEVAKVVENLLPPPEEPQLPVVSATIEDTPIMAKAEEIIKIEEAKIEAPIIEKTLEAQAKPEEINKQEVLENPSTETAPKEVNVAVNPPQTNETKPIEAEAIKKAPIPQPVKQQEIHKEVKTSAASDLWQVQLISSSNRQAVDNAWSGLVKKYPMLEGQPQEIETAYLGAKGTFYRLKAGAFNKRVEADNLCNDIKALGGTCIVKKK